MPSAVYMLLILLPVLILLTICVYTDIKHRLIYDRWTIPSMIYFLIVQLMNGSLGKGIIGLLVLGLTIYALAWITKGGIGGGDIKLYAALGAAFGMMSGLWIAAIASILAAIGSIPLLIIKRYRYLPAKYNEVPMAPFIAAGTAAVIALAIYPQMNL